MLTRIAMRTLPRAAVRSAGGSSSSPWLSSAVRPLSQHAAADASLWDRMGGEPVIKPMVGEIVDLHTSDPLTKNWFGEGRYANTGDRDHIVDRVFTFFSAGIGGPYEYKGKDMVATHAGMHINGPAFHAVANHVLVKMQEHGAGGHTERDEVLGILYSLKDDVFARNSETGLHGGFDARQLPTSGDTVAGAHAEGADASLWDRMGGEEVIRPMVTEIVGLHTTDPLTAPYFGPDKFRNNGHDAYVIDRVFTFFSAGIGGPYEYEGKDMVETHVGMNISHAAFHAVAQHVMVKMEEHGAGGHAEREEVLDILFSLKDEVFQRSADPQPDGDDTYTKFDPTA